jgi:hypothetical protein
VISRGNVTQLANLMEECLIDNMQANLKRNSKRASNYFGYVNNAKMTLDHLG